MVRKRIMSVERGFPGILFALLLTCQGGARAEEQALRFGDYTVYYTALTSDVLPRQVAEAHNIVRSPNRALLNVTVLRGGSGLPDEQGVPAQARLRGSAVNLNGQGRSLSFREIREADDAIYYIAETHVSHQEVLKFSIRVTPLDAPPQQPPLEFTFEQEFYTRP